MLSRPTNTTVFTIVEDLGTRVALDTEFHFARVRLPSGEVVLASFDQRNFARLTVGSREIRASFAGSLFAEGPTTYNTVERIEARERMDSEAVSQALDAYGLEVWAYRQGERKTKPDFPDWKAIPHWVDDFKLLAQGAAPEHGGVVHLRIHTDDLRLKAKPAEFGFPATLRQAARRFTSGIGRIIIRKLQQVHENERNSRPAAPGLLDPIIDLFDIATDALVARIRRELAARRPIAAARAAAAPRAPA